MRAAVTAVAIAGLLAGCSHDAWMADETDRIGAVINGTPRSASVDPVERLLELEEDEDGEPIDPLDFEELRGPRSKRARKSAGKRWYVPRTCDDEVALRD